MCTQWMASIIEDRHIHQSEDICWVSFIAIKDADDYTEYYFLFNIPPQLRKYHKYQTIFSIFLSDNNRIDWTAVGARDRQDLYTKYRPTQQSADLILFVDKK